MDLKDQRALIIAATCQIERKGNLWLVPSQTSPGRVYRVKLDGDGSWIVGFREPNQVMALERFPDREMPAGDDLKAEMELANRIRAAIQLST